VDQEEKHALNQELSSMSIVDLQLMWNRLLALVEEQAQVLMRTAFSPIVRECGDISAGVFDARGRMLAQAVTGTPGHINTMAEGVKLFLQFFPAETMKRGDVYLTNDPWVASGHLNDFMLVQPIYHNGAFVGLAACTSHLVDVGGLGMGPTGTDIYDEGLFIPPMKLVDGGEVNATFLAILKANGREPTQNEGDVYALISCCEAGCARVIEMMREFGISQLDELADYIIGKSYDAVVREIHRVPPGVYQNALCIDGYDFEIDLHARLTVGEREMVIDFDGSSPCSRYGINVPLNYATAYTVFGVRCIVGPDIPNNAGSLTPFRVLAPPGCILNAQHPAPVAMRHMIGQLTPDLVFGCLHQALPDRVPAEGASCMYDLPMRSAPSHRQGSNATRFAIELAHNGGTGARPTKDGLSATAYPSGVWGSQVEITESVAPILVRRRELRPDSGGAGKFRGGLGQIIEVESAEGAPISLFLSVERLKYPARGRVGGHDGKAGHIALSSGEVFAGKGEFTIPGNERLIFETPGGAGFGNPLDRSPEEVGKDVRRGLVSRDVARQVYGVVVDETGRVNNTETERLRRRAGGSKTARFAHS
jgi:N-methylhydantoinase B